MNSGRFVGWNIVVFLTVNQYLIYFYADMRCQIYFCSS